MKLNSLVAQIICAPNFNNFSAVEVRSSYLSLHHDKTLCSSATRRFVYAELVKLLNQGWLQKRVTKKKGLTNYYKTKLFNTPAIIGTVTEPGDAQFHQAKAIEIELKNKLIAYKNELLVTLAECEEYQSLNEDYPTLRKGLEKNYNDSRDKNTKLLGKIKAIESLFSTDEVVNSK